MSSTHLASSLPPATGSSPSADTAAAGVASTSAAPTKVQMTSHNQYSTPRLLREQLHPDPLIQFNAWLTLALEGDETTSSPKVREPEAMALSTVALVPSTSSPAGGSSPQVAIPSTRVVLLKATDARGFIFYTNYTSRKSTELLANPCASLCFYWREVSRQVRVVGRVEKVDRKDSEEYFATRPRGSRIGAWASPQSQVVQDGEVLQRVEEVTKRFTTSLSTSGRDATTDGAVEEKEIECPEFWGGWRVVPFEIEFWSGQLSRLHDRFRYLRTEGEEWKIDRLGP